jgi:hypothetical protein
MRVIVRKERLHIGTQLRFTDIDGHGSPPSPPTLSPGWFTDLELRHRGRPTCGDRIGNAKDTGLRNLPLRGFD